MDRFSMGKLVGIMEFEWGTKVTIHSLGSTLPGEYRGVIHGIAVRDTVEPAQIYIVQIFNDFPLDNNYDYDHITFPRACLREGWHD